MIFSAIIELSSFFQNHKGTESNLTVFNTDQDGCVVTSPGSLSDLITMLRHNMAAISKIGEFRIHFASFAICSVLLGLSTQSSSRSGQERKEPCVLARWRSKTNDNDVKCY